MPAPYSITITNPGAESTIATGWTTLVSSITRVTSDGTITPHTGSYFFKGGAIANNYEKGIIYQDRDMTLDGVPTSELDDGSLMAELVWWQTNSKSRDRGVVGIQFYDGSSNKIEGICNAQLVAYASGAAWTERTYHCRVPEGARVARIMMFAEETSGSTCGASFDDLSLTLVSNTFDPRGTRAVISFRDTNDATINANVNQALGVTPSIADLVAYADGSSTGWSLSTLSSAFNNTSDTAAVSWDPLAADTGPGVAVVYLTTKDPELRISGLDTSRKYTVRIYGCRDAAVGGRSLQAVINSVTKSHIGDFNYTDYVTFSDISPDGSGNIDMYFYATAGDTYAYLSTIEVEEEYVAPTPPAPESARRIMINVS